MNIRDTINGPASITAMTTIARFIPNPAGYRMARFLADKISSRHNLDLVKAVRINQWVAHGRQPGYEELNHIVKQTFRHTATCLFDLYHNYRNNRNLLRLIDFDEPMSFILSKVSARSEPFILVAAHMSNFDLLAFAVAYHGTRIAFLTFPDGVAGYERQNKLRSSMGVDMIPTSLSGLKRASELIGANGTIVTGVDRPTAGEKYRPRFFGLPAPIPVHYIALALRTRIPIHVVSSHMKPNGHYGVSISEPLEMEKFGDRHKDLVLNAERVLGIVENFIREHPTQWSMTFSIWPELEDSLPQK